MPDYEVTDNVTGRSYILTGDSPPTDAELEEIFSSQSVAVDTDTLPAMQEAGSEVDMSEWGSGATGAISDFAQGTAEDIVGVGEVVATIATGAASSILSSAAGAVNMALGLDDVDSAREAIDAITDARTFMPRTDSGKQFLEVLAAPLMALEEGADDISWKLGMGNEYAATIIKTTVLGAIDLLLPSKGALNTLKAKNALRLQIKSIKETAARLGIKPNIHELRETVVSAAANMTPAQRAQNIPVLKEALETAEAAAKGRKNAAYEVAKKTDTWVETRAVRSIADEMEVKLFDDGYDLNSDGMKVVRDTLDDMRTSDLGPGGSFTNEAIAVRFNQLDLVLKRINKRWKAGADEANAGLSIIKKEINRFIGNEFDKIAMKKGRSAISGDDAAAGVAAWKEAKALNKAWRDDFYADKVIAKFIKEEVTPEQFREWLMGATYMNARKEATSTIARMREILGDNHPAIEGIRQDFLFEVAAPLLSSKPNFSQFLKNYDTMIRRNPSLVKELGLDTKNFDELVHFARTADKLPKAGHDFQLTDLTKGLAVFWQGHSMAKRALRVGYARNILNGLIDIDRLGQKQIIYAVAGLKYGEVMFPKKGPLAAQFIAGAALTEIANTQEQ